jgi:hypothetical protein
VQPIQQSPTAGIRQSAKNRILVHVQNM